MLFVVFVFRPTMNYVFNYNDDEIINNKNRRVRFADDQVVHYHLSDQERNMKRTAYKKIRIQSRHYRKMDHLCYLMEGLKIKK